MPIPSRALRATLPLCTFLLGACGASDSPPVTDSAAGSPAVSDSAGAPSAGAPSISGAGAPSAGSPAGGSGAAGAPSNPAGSSGVGSDSTAGSQAAGGSGGGGGLTGGSGAGGAAMAGAAGANVNQGNLPAVTLFLAGDSTVMDYGSASAQEGWGQELGQYFISKVTIDNRALGGTSVQTFQSRWTGIVSSLKAGDFAMADFGINDSGGVAGRSVTTADFKTTMAQMNTQTKGKQATFVIVTPSALQYWTDGMETNARLAPYVAVENELGATGIPLVDLNAQSLKFLNMIGQTAAKEIYIDGDKAHFTKKGATQMASFVADELRRIKSPLAAYLK